MLAQRIETYVDDGKRFYISLIALSDAGQEICHLFYLQCGGTRSAPELPCFRIFPPAPQSKQLFVQVVEVLKKNKNGLKTLKREWNVTTDWLCDVEMMPPRHEAKGLRYPWLTVTPPAEFLRLLADFQSNSA